MANIMTMPKFGLTMEEGTVTKWHKSEGDTVKAGELLFEVATDKLTNEVEAEFDGVLIKIICAEGETVPCKAPVCAIGAAGETYDGGAAPAPAAAAPAPTAAPAAATPAPAAAPAAAEGNIVIMPKFGLTMEEGTVTKWLKNEGDTVKAGEPLFEVATDKLTNEVESEFDGVVLKIYCAEGQTVKCKEPVCAIGEPGATVAAAAAPAPAAEAPVAAPAADAPEAAGNIVIMPKFGLTMEEGTVTKWFKNEGETVKAGEPLFEVATDKLTNEVESEFDGVVLKIYCAEGQAVKCKEPVCAIGEPGAVISTAAPAASPAPVAAPAAAVSATAAPAVSAPAVTPKEGYIPATPAAKKFAKDKGVSLAEVAAVCGKDTVSVKDIEEAIAGHKVKVTGYIPASPAAKKLAKEKGVNLEEVTATGMNGMVTTKDVEAYLVSAPKVKTSPVAAKLAADMGVNVADLGAQGRVMKADVLGTSSANVAPVAAPAAAAPAATAPASAKEEKVVKLKGMRKVIATRMKESWNTSPRVTFNVSVDTTAIKELRSKLNPALKDSGIKISFNHIIMKVLAKVLMEFPEVNSSLVGDDLIMHPEANIGLAVALDNGLIVPNVKGCDSKSLSQIAVETEEKIKAAKSNKLSMDDLVGATCTITNLGMFGIESFTPIINQPELAILGVCAIIDTPVVRDGQIVVKPMMNLSLVADHRVVNGAVAAEFLQRIKECLENPYLLLA